MPSKNSIFLAVSFDGYIARQNGSLDWLDRANANVPKGEDCGFRQFMGSVDALVMGRNTFEQVLTFGQWPYGKMPVVVLSRRPLEIPADLKATVSASSGEPETLCQRLAESGFKHLYIDGGITIQRFLKAGLIDEMIITRVPVILGEGKSLFGSVAKDIGLDHIETRAFDFGYVQSKYRVHRG